MFGFICMFFCQPRKNILRFLDAERDVSVVKSSFKPGDVIHYVLDRRRTLNISQDLHSLLPEVSPMKNRRFKTCAVVGNSGILLDSGCGKEIDSHDFVIRWVVICCWRYSLLCFLEKSGDKCFNLWYRFQALSVINLQQYPSLCDSSNLNTCPCCWQEDYFYSENKTRGQRREVCATYFCCSLFLFQTK